MYCSAGQIGYFVAAVCERARLLIRTRVLPSLGRYCCVNFVAEEPACLSIFPCSFCAGSNVKNNV